MSCNISGNSTSSSLAGAGGSVNYVFGVTVDSGSGQIELDHMAEGEIGLTFGNVLDNITGGESDTVTYRTELPSARDFDNIDRVISEIESELGDAAPDFFSSGGLSPTPSPRDLVSQAISDLGSVDGTMNLRTFFEAPLVGTFAEQGEDPVRSTETLRFSPIQVPDAGGVRDAVNNMGTVTFTSELKSTSYLRNITSDLVGERIEVSHEVDASCFFTFTSAPEAPERPEPDTDTPLDCVNEYPSINDSIESLRDRIQDASEIRPGDLDDLLSRASDIESEIRSSVDDDPCISEFKSEVDRLKGEAKRMVEELDCSDVSSSIKAEVEDAQSDIRSFRDISPMDRDTSKRDRLFDKIDNVMEEVVSEVDDRNPCKDELISDLESAESELERVRIFEEEDFECASRFPDADDMVSDFEERADNITSSIEEEEFEDLINFEESVANAIEQVEEGECRREFLRRFDNADRIISRTVQPVRIGEETLSRAEERRQDLIDSISTSVDRAGDFADRSDGQDFFDRESPLDDVEGNGGENSVIRESAESESGSTITVEIPTQEVVERFPEPEQITEEDLQDYVDVDDINEEELPGLVDRVRDEASSVLNGDIL